MNLWVHKRLEISSPAERPVATQVALFTSILGLKLSKYNILAIFTAEFL
jgi:hypothetical protein